MPDYGLSSQQLAVICALSSGANMTTAAEHAGVHRNTIANWRRNSLPFQQGFAHAQYDRALYYREKLEDQIDLAIQSLRDILTDPKAAPSVKLKAALIVIQTAITPPDPKKQVELDIEKIVVKRNEPEIVTPEAFSNDQFQPAPEPEIGVNPRSSAANSPTAPEPQSENSPTEHKIAQPTPKICVNSRPFAANSSQPRKHRDIPRNAKCPCGSGKKFKRCCLNRPPLATAA